MRKAFLALISTVMLAAGPVAAQHAPHAEPGAGRQAHGASAQGRVGQLIEQMRGGGLVLVIRHERTEVPSREDDYTRPASDCTAQRNLSVAGAAGALETGFALRSLGIRVTRVISSPMCRATETARYMFGAYTLDPRLIHPNPGVPGGRDVGPAGEELTQILRSVRPGEGNTAMVSHGGNIAGATGLRLAEGEIGVIRVHADGRIEALGQVLGSDLGPHARLALPSTGE